MRGGLRPSPIARRATAFTLIELVMGLTLATVVFLAIGSTMLMASKALPGDDHPTEKLIECANALDLLVEELQFAISFSERSATAVQFTVADRNDDEASELIRYEWSGEAGDSLFRIYNYGPAVEVAGHVERLQLEYVLRPAKVPPRVLMMVPDEGGFSGQDMAKMVMIASWGYPVTPIPEDVSQASFDEALTRASVLYISEELWTPNVVADLRRTVVGVVSEELALADELGLSSDTYNSNDKKKIEILDNSHPITFDFATGDLEICSSSSELLEIEGTLAGGADVLAEKDGASNDPVLLAIDAGGVLYGGSKAVGRRVQLPWGGQGFDFTLLTANGLKLMQRSIDWAAGSNELTAVKITLQSGSDNESLVQAEARILNQPRISGP